MGSLGHQENLDKVDMPETVDKNAIHRVTHTVYAKGLFFYRVIEIQLANRSKLSTSAVLY